jgi:hypothetical protein
MCALISIDPYKFRLTLLCILFSIAAAAQRDSAKNLQPVDSVLKQAPVAREKSKIDSVVAVHSPKKAATRSAILPGWGQAYNRKYWKIPIIYAALGTTAGVFVYNLTNYRDLKYAYQVRYRQQVNPADTFGLSKIKANLRPLDVQSLRFYRDDFRKNIDYSVLFFLFFWGLNVVDATVDAHLKSFDVSPDLSFRIKPGKSQMAGTTGVSFVLALK